MSQRVVILVMVCLCTLAGAAGVAAAGGTAGDPLADAGLDQSVAQGTTVYLDAGGSVSPNGEIVDYEWTIERPDGTTTTPACQTCERTRFQPAQTGVYNATVTVTDDKGRSSTDTLRVTVTEAEPPEVTLSGPQIVLTDGTPRVNLTATAGDDPLSSLTWLVDGQQYDAKFVDGNTTTDSITLSATEPGEVVVEARVTDQRGRSATAEHSLKIEDGQFGVTNETLVTESGRYDLDSLEIEFTGSETDHRTTELGKKYVYEGETWGYTIGFRTYEESSGETIKTHPFSQSTASFPHLGQDANPHSYQGFTNNAKKIDTSASGGTLRATSPGYSKFSIYHSDDDITTIIGFRVKVEKKDNEDGGDGGLRDGSNDDGDSSGNGAESGNTDGDNDPPLIGFPDPPYDDNHSSLPGLPDPPGVTL